MELFKWTDEYSVKSEVLDTQHKKLFEIINNLYSAFAKNEHNKILGDILEELHQYTIYHFSEEARILDEKNKPLPLEHIKAHEQFIQKIEEFKQKFEKGKAGITYEIMNFLRQWLKDHILGKDKEYASAF